MADPGSITTIELALDTAHAARIAPMWAAILTGSTDAHGRGTIGEDVRDAAGRVPILWFQDTDEHETPRQRFHLDVWVAPEVADQRIAAAVAAGGDDRGRQPAPVVHGPRRPGRQQGVRVHVPAVRYRAPRPGRRR